MNHEKGDNTGGRGNTRLEIDTRKKKHLITETSVSQMLRVLTQHNNIMRGLRRFVLFGAFQECSQSL
jgi:cob(I)alamin adenosyltransferase